MADRAQRIEPDPLPESAPAFPPAQEAQATASARFADGVAPHRPLGAQGVETGCDIAPPRRRGSVGITRGGAPQEADHPKTGRFLKEGLACELWRQIVDLLYGEASVL